jgi:hypothetical protein
MAPVTADVYGAHVESDGDYWVSSRVEARQLSPGCAVILKDGSPADPPQFVTSTPTWHECDTFPTRPGRTFRILAIDDSKDDWYAVWTVCTERRLSEILKGVRPPLMIVNRRRRCNCNELLRGPALSASLRSSGLVWRWVPAARAE